MKFLNLSNLTWHHKLAVLFLSLFVLLFFVSKTYCHFSGIKITYSNPLCRIAPCDVFGLLGICFSMIGSIRDTWKPPKVILYYVLFLLLILPGVFLTTSTSSFTTSYLILLGALMIVSSLIYTFREAKLLNSLILMVVIGSIIGTMIGFYDFFANHLGLPNIFSPRSYIQDGQVIEIKNDLLSGFRKSAQAGREFYIMLCVVVPVFISSYLSQMVKHKILILSAIFLLIPFIIFTFKMSAVLSLVTSLGLLLIWVREEKVKRLLVFITLILLAFFMLVKIVSPGLIKYGERKFNTRIAIWFDSSKRHEKSTDKFLLENYSGALHAFLDRPLTGAGLGSFPGKYSNHEIHSSPVAVIGETGLLGIIGYSLFLFCFFSYFIKSYRSNTTIYSDFIVRMTPFIAGAIFIWGYDIHLRSRAFWILLSIVTIVYRLHRKEQMLILNSKSST